MESVISPVDVRQLLLSILRADATPPKIRPGHVATCEGINVARRSLTGELSLRCFRAAHGTAPQYASIQSALCKLVGGFPKCTTCGGKGWLAIDGKEAREAALKSLAFGAFRGIRFESLSSADELLKQSSMLDLISDGTNCGKKTVTI